MVIAVDFSIQRPQTAIIPILSTLIGGLLEYDKHKSKKENTSSNQTHNNTKHKNSYEPPPPSPPHEEAPRSRQDEAIKLVNLGLACIGRKTKRTNLYLTPEREAERHRAEYTFLRQLAEKYRDAATRKVLAQHFMLFKEFCLFIIFSVVLKGDTELHTLVRTELTERLTEDLDIMTKHVASNTCSLSLRLSTTLTSALTAWSALSPILSGVSLPTSTLS